MHTDWIFDTQWISDNLLISGQIVCTVSVVMILCVAGSRDSNMALWSISSTSLSSASSKVEEGNVMLCKDEEEQNEPMNLAENVPVIQPIFTFSNLLLEPHVLATNESERVRSLSYNSNSHVSSLTNGQNPSPVQYVMSWLIKGFAPALLAFF